MYPIRTSRPIWTRTFLRPHTCSELCNTEYEFKDESIRITYRTGCLFPERVEPLHIHIADHYNVTYMDDAMNIPNTVQLRIEHPLRHPFALEHTFDTVCVRISDVMRVYDQIYTRIYKEEEEQATKQNFLIDKHCPDCKEEDYTADRIDEYLEPVILPDVIDPEDDTSACSICFEMVYSTDEQPCLFTIRNCQHIFHRQCILKWFKTPKVVDQDETLPITNSCPICRQAIIYCNTCKGTTMVKERFYGSVPPYDPESEEERIETDGPYGIHSIYYEDLYFKGVLYDRVTNSLSLLPFESAENEPE